MLLSYAQISRTADLMSLILVLLCLLRLGQDFNGRKLKKTTIVLTYVQAGRRLWGHLVIK